MAIQTTASPINSTGSFGNVLNDSARVRNGVKDWNVDQANVNEGLQRQIDQIAKLLNSPTPALQTFSVTDTDGSLLAWIGDVISNAKTYFGGWFKQLYIGGTGPADAVISADSTGDVEINGATITLVKNGVTTIIGNAQDPANPTAYMSLESKLDPYLTYVSPFWIKSNYKTSPTTYVSLSTIGAAGLSSFLNLSNVAQNAFIQAQVNFTGTVNLVLLDSLGNTTTITGANVSSAGTDMATIKSQIAALQASVASLVANKADHGSYTGTVSGSFCNTTI